FTVDKPDLAKARTIVDSLKGDVGFQEASTDEHVAKLSLVGVGMRSHAGVAAKMFEALAAEQINIGAISTSEIKISLLIDLAQGVALSARQLGIRAVIVMPRTTPEIKIAAVKALGAEVILEGDHYAEAQEHCDTIRAKKQLAFVHPFDDPLVIAGAGTVGMEIL